jgi:hypothetical protein
MAYMKYYNMQKSRSSQFLFLILFVLCYSKGIAQDASSSPYSRFGIGDIQAAGVSQNLGMGGVNIAMYHPLGLNYSNPAAYGRLQLTTFDAGVNASLMELKSMQKVQSNSDVSLGYFAFAFPLKSRKAGMGFGIVPLSNVGYKINDLQTNTLGNPELHVYEGSGGLHQFFLSTGFTPFKNLTAGVSASYLFGSINQERRVEFSDASFMNSQLLDTRDQRGFYYTFGLQYTLDSLRLSPSDSVRDVSHKLDLLEDSLENLQRNIKKGNLAEPSGIDAIQKRIQELEKIKSGIHSRHQRGEWNLVAGLTFSPGSSLKAERSVIANTFRYLDPYTKEQIVVKDTQFYSTEESGSIRLPLGFGFGLALKKGSQWIIASDVRLQNWSTYRSYGQSDSLANSYRASLGVQFTPDERGFNSVWNQVNYMAGFHYSNSFLQLRGNQLTEMGISAGLGIPIRRGLTCIRIMAEAGKRGTTDSGLLEEKYVRFTFGFSLSDRWFIKQRYD